MPDGENHWEIIYGWSGNPITFGQPHLRGFMRRLSLGDWGDLPLHELSHDFDNANWEFDAEALSFFKMYYVIEQLNAEVYRSDVAAYHDGNGNFQNAWYTGREYYSFLRDDYYKGYKAYFDKGRYSGGGLATILIELKNITNWEPVKKTFRYFSSLSASQAPRNNGEKLKLFLTKLKDYSGKDVLNYINNHDERIIEEHFGIDLQYVDPVYPDAGGGGGSSGARPEINIPGGKYITYQFTPANSAVYYIYTSPYAGSGVSNDTYLEVYENASLTGTPIASNDDYGGSRFSKVSVSMTEGITYYIRVRHYNNEQIHAQLNITKNVPVQPLTLDVRENIITANGEYAMFSFTPEATQMYTFDVENYNGGTSAYDTYIKLYENESMTKRIGQNGSKIIASLSAGQTYYLQFSGFLMKYARGSVGVKEAQTLEFTKKTDSNFIYVNNPEYITKYDIVDSGAIEQGQSKPLKIFQQIIDGKNTYYQTHISWYNNPDNHEVDFPDLGGFYLDVDFYNPNSSTVTVTIENLAKSNYYSDLQDYFGVGPDFVLTLQPGQHKRLLCNDIYDSPLHVTPSTANMAILFDFTVSGNYNIILSSLAAYNLANLVMQDGSIDKLTNGTELNSGDIVKMTLIKGGRVKMTYLVSIKVSPKTNQLGLMPLWNTSLTIRPQVVKPFLFICGTHFFLLGWQIRNTCGLHTLIL